MNNKRINLSFTEEEFNMIQEVALRTNRKVANLIKTWVLEKLSKTCNFQEEEEERESLAIKKLKCRD